MAQKYCISIDWLEVCGYGAVTDAEGVWVKDKFFELHQVDRQTAFFKKFHIVKFRGMEYAYIRSCPRLSRVNANFLCIKLANRVLYHEHCIQFLWDLLKALHVRYKGITRLDLAYDCNKFYNGRAPHKFVRDFVSKPIGERGGMYLAYCRDYTLHGRKSIGNDGQLNYISFGSSMRGKRAYIYDKSLELQEVKDKPWIRDMWERNGLVHDEKHHVWRAEISIKCEGKDLLNLDTGQLFTLNPNYLDCYDKIKKVFHYYARKVFDFRINDGQKNRRNFTPLNLFDTSVEITCLPKRVSNLCDSGRAEKVCRNKLVSITKEYVDLSESVKHSFYAAIEFMTYISNVKGAKYRSEQQLHYLNHLHATRFIDEIDAAYMEACYQLSEERNKTDRDLLWERYCHLRGLQDASDGLV